MDEPEHPFDREDIIEKLDEEADQEPTEDRLEEL